MLLWRLPLFSWEFHCSRPVQSLWDFSFWWRFSGITHCWHNSAEDCSLSTRFHLTLSRIEDKKSGRTDRMRQLSLSAFIFQIAVTHSKEGINSKFYVLLTVHFSTVLENDQLGTHCFILQYDYYNPLSYRRKLVLVVWSYKFDYNRWLHNSYTCSFWCSCSVILVLVDLHYKFLSYVDRAS